jgi:hypothetical protein
MAQPIKYPVTFQAQWTPQNVQWKNLELSTVDKVKKIAWDVLSVLFLPLGIARVLGWAVHFIAKKMVLPSAWFYPHQILQRAKGIFNVCCRNLQNQFEIQKHKILTPDGIKLNLIHFKHHRADENTPTILFYQSNASISQLGIYLWLVEDAVRRNVPCNFVVFDYRGVGSSKGDAQSTQDLLIDGDTALQFVKDHLKVPPEKIGFYTWSLGWGIGGTIKAAHPECTGPIVSERSFSSLRSVGEHIIPRFLQPLFWWVPWAAEKQGWQLRVPLEKIKGPVLILYHKNDQTIHYPASAHKASVLANLQIPALELYQTPEQLAETQERIIDHHFEDLTTYYVAPGMKANEAVANFILPRAAPAA